LRARDGVFFVTGNHEYYSGASPWVRELRRLGLTVLMNEHVVVRRGGARLVVAGVTDFSAATSILPRRATRGALAGSPAGATRVLLAHQPRSAAAAEAAGFDLQLSGHTHGGQFLPGPCSCRLQQPFTAGLHRWRRMWVYTSRGTGYWGPPRNASARRPRSRSFARRVGTGGSTALAVASPAATPLRPRPRGRDGDAAARRAPRRRVSAPCAPGRPAASDR
jgi:predicted MPP superfamily phosphohydrolase